MNYYKEIITSNYLFIAVVSSQVLNSQVGVNDFLLLLNERNSRLKLSKIQYDRYFDCFVIKC